MALIGQTVAVQLGTLNTKQDERWLVPGDLVASRNLRFDRWPRLLKRFGYAQLGAPAAAGVSLNTFKQQLLLGTGAKASSYASSGLVDKGVMEAITVSALPVRRDSYSQTSPDSAIHPSGITVCAWETSAGGAQYAVFDTVTRQPIVAGVSLGATAQRPKVFALANNVVILFFDLNHLRYVAIPALNPTNPSPLTDFALDPATTPPVFDATVVNSGGDARLTVVYANTGGANRITLKTLSAQLGIGAPIVPTTTEVLNTCCAIFADPLLNVWVAYYTGTQVRLFVYDFALANRLLDFTTLDASPGTVRNITGIAPTGRAGGAILYEVTGSASYNNLIRTATAKLGLNVPVNAAFTQGAGTLANGPYYYRVTALNADGETTPSAETSFTIAGGPAGVNVNWTAVPGATGYRVYGRSTGAELLIATVGAVTTFLDNGSVTPLGAMPTVNTTTVIAGPAVLLRSVGLASKPFFYLGSVHVLAAYQSTLQSTYFLLAGGAFSFLGASVVAKLAPGLGGGLTAKSILPEMNNPAPGIYSTAYLQTDQIGVQAALVFSQAGVMAGTFDFTQPPTAVELSDNLHLCGGILWMYDGGQTCEHCFHLYPENNSLVQGAGAILAGTYVYCVTYEWMDAQGLLHQSAPSPTLSTTITPGPNNVTLTIPTLRLTSKTNPVSIVVWRTQANQSVFYRLNSIASPLINSTTADTVAYVDNAVDTAIGGNAQLQFNPLNNQAEIPNLAAPAPLHVWRYRNRACLIPAEAPFEWMFSKAMVPGVPIEFNGQQLFQAVAQDGGPLTCGIEMDEKNILFTATKPYYVVGDGPAPNGSGSDYGLAPIAIPSDVGCANKRSLVLTPEGVMFQAAGGKGIYLLGRNLAVSYIGAEVEAYNGLTITAAKMVPNSRRVLFFTDGGVALAWDYFARKWSVWTNHAAVDAAIFGGLVTYLKAGGQIWQETPGLYTDNGAPVLAGFTTSWLAFAGLSGFQRLWRFMVLGDYRSPHILQVSVAYDGNPAPLQTETVNAGTLLGTGLVGGLGVGGRENPGGGPFPGYEFLVKPAIQKCSSVQITVQESQLGPSYGEGLSISSLSFLVGKLPRLHPVAKSRSI